VVLHATAMLNSASMTRLSSVCLSVNLSVGLSVMDVLWLNGAR